MKLVCPFCSGSFEENVKPDVAAYPCRYCGMDIDPKAPPRVHVRTTPSKKPAAPKPAASNQSKPSSAQRQTVSPDVVAPAQAQKPAQSNYAAQQAADPVAVPAQAQKPVQSNYAAAGQQIAAPVAPAQTQKPAQENFAAGTKPAPGKPGKATDASLLTDFMSAYDANALSGEELYDKVIPSVVEIAVQSVNSAAAASGFIVSSIGMAVTNAHAVLDQNGQLFEQIYVRYNEQYYAAVPIALGEPLANQDYDTIDLCLLFVPELWGATAIEFADINTLKNGQRVYLIGNSLGAGTCITSGIISDKNRFVGNLSYPYIMTDAAANPGNSGGPLLNVTGEIIGVLVAGISSAKGMNYAIPVDILERFLEFVINETGLNELDLAELNRLKKDGTARSAGMLFDRVKLRDEGIRKATGQKANQQVSQQLADQELAGL